MGLKGLVTICMSIAQASRNRTEHLMVIRLFEGGAPCPKLEVLWFV